MCFQCQPESWLNISFSSAPTTCMCIGKSLMCAGATSPVHVYLKVGTIPSHIQYVHGFCNIPSHEYRVRVHVLLCMFIQTAPILKCLRISGEWCRDTKAWVGETSRKMAKLGRAPVRGGGLCFFLSLSKTMTCFLRQSFTAQTKIFIFDNLQHYRITTAMYTARSPHCNGKPPDNSVCPVYAQLTWLLFFSLYLRKSITLFFSLKGKQQR